VFVARDASSVLSDKSVALLASLFGQDVDGLEPCHHGVVRLGAENPRVSTMHATTLATLEHEFVGRRVGRRVRTEFLVWEVEGHDGRLRVDFVCRFKLVEMRGREDVPVREIRWG